MNTGEALKTLINAGYITREEADKIERSYNSAKQERLRKVREVANRALVDYLIVLCPDIDVDEHKRFVTVLFKELEADLIGPDEEEDSIKKFLKSIGVA